MLYFPTPQEEIKAAESRGEKMATVSQDIRLDNRFLDLRTPANQAIFKVQSGVCQVRPEPADQGGSLSQTSH